MLGGEVKEGDRVMVRWDTNEQKVAFERRPRPERVVEKKPPAPSTSASREPAPPLAAQGGPSTGKSSPRHAGSHRPRKAS
jgi:ATP-dependent Clp protease ATP-binding subunit ClpC